MNLQELVARLAELTAELARVEVAIKAFASSSQWKSGLGRTSATPAV